MPVRTAKGQFTQSPETREFLSKLQRERYERERAEDPHPVRGEKRCSACEQWKHYDMEDAAASEFSPNTRTFKDGGKRRYPSGKCKACAAQEAADRRNALTSNERNRRRRRYMRKYREQNRQKVRDYGREYQRQRRRAAGVPVRGPWKKYRTPAKGIRVDPKPFIEWLDEWLALTGVTESELIRRAIGKTEKKDVQIVARNLHRVRSGEAQTMDLFYVDEIFTAAGMPDLTVILYPDA